MLQAVDRVVETDVATVDIAEGRGVLQRVIQRGVESSQLAGCAAADLDTRQGVVPLLARGGPDRVQVPSRDFRAHVLLRTVDTDIGDGHLGVERAVRAGVEGEVATRVSAVHVDGLTRRTDRGAVPTAGGGGGPA